MPATQRELLKGLISSLAFEELRFVAKQMKDAWQGVKIDGDTEFKVIKRALEKEHKCEALDEFFNELEKRSL